MNRLLHLFPIPIKSHVLHLILKGMGFTSLPVLQVMTQVIAWSNQEEVSWEKGYINIHIHLFCHI